MLPYAHASWDEDNEIEKAFLPLGTNPCPDGVGACVSSYLT